MTTTEHTPLLGVDRPRLLLVEDDAELVCLLDRLLTGEGYAVVSARDAQTGLHQGLTRAFHVTIIDRGLPAMDGVELTARLRRQGVCAPILLLTAYGTVRDRVDGLDAGADDYLVKPFDVDELLARLRALCRRHQDRAQSLVIGAAELDLPARVARWSDGTEVALSGRETALLHLLASRPGQVFTREQVRAHVFDAAESLAIVDTYVHYLRRKLGDGAVRTVRGVGYRVGTLCPR